MSSPLTKVFLVTANIASCFDNPKAMISPWLNEFIKVLKQRLPHFVAVHCQEVGGKNYETSEGNVQQFVNDITARVECLGFNRSRVFIDEEYSAADKFTALGNLYFIREDVKNVSIWDFIENEFKDADGKLQYVGNIEDVQCKEKSKFPQEFFPQCKWSRKGFLRTRWSINGTVIDLVNIHLFHDASNFVAMERFPSEYTLNRKRAMDHTLDRFHNDRLTNAPIFLFGDFNFRLDTGSVVQKLTENCSSSKDEEVGGETTREFMNKANGKSVLSISKKCFSHVDHSSIFQKDNGQWLRPFDKELKAFEPRLLEYPISFPPSYPFEEGVEGRAEAYMKTRCPSWCDRIVLNQSAKELIDKGKSEVMYDMIGKTVTMGDHKPIGMLLWIPQGSGVVLCCSEDDKCPNFVHKSQNQCFSVGHWCRCEAYPVCPGRDLSGSPCSVDCQSPKYVSGSVVDGKSELVSEETKELSNNSASNKSKGVLLKKFFRRNFGSQEEKESDPALKRVHSDPVKVRNYCNTGKTNLPLHSNLVYSHSLDVCKTSKLRLRASSSRLISHHSSSSEEWFEEVPPSPETHQTTLNPDDVFWNANVVENPKKLSIPKSETSHVSFRNDECFVYNPHKSVKQDDSLNNLLLADTSKRDNCSKVDAKSMSEVSCSDVSLRLMTERPDKPCSVSMTARSFVSSTDDEVESETKNHSPSVTNDGEDKKSCCSCVVS